MKPITILGKQYWYKLVLEMGEWTDYIYTEIFDSPIKIRRKYILFGKLVEVENDKPIHTIFLNIESILFSKEKVKFELESGVTKYNQRKSRQKEIDNGQII